MVTASHTYGRTGGSASQDPFMFAETYADLPDPTQKKPGDMAFVNMDPNNALNGLHAVHGVGSGQYWRKT